MLLDPSTPDKMSLTLANGDIIRPSVHDLKREQMYAGGGGGLLYHPVSTWIKFEECTLNLGRATSVEDNNSGEDNNTDTNEENSMDDSQDSDLRNTILVKLELWELVMVFNNNFYSATKLCLRYASAKCGR